MNKLIVRGQGTFFFNSELPFELSNQDHTDGLKVCNQGIYRNDDLLGSLVTSLYNYCVSCQTSITV
jgi:hypothetical protein